MKILPLVVVAFLIGLALEARINRAGQTRKMTYIDIIAEDTVDEKIVKALKSKMNIASKITGDALKDWI